MSIILSIETSTTVCSIAIHQAEKLVANFELFLEKSHAENITILIENITKHTKFELTQFDAIAVSKGPGSYTGLRIGASTAKGLCYALDKPLITIETLHAMAAQIIHDLPIKSQTLFCPMIDARRMEVYCTILDKDLQIIQPTQAKIIDETSFAELFEENEVIFFGNGSQKCQTTFANQKNAYWIANVYPSAKWIGNLASKAFKEGIFENVAHFEPYYLKDFVTNN